MLGNMKVRTKLLSGFLLIATILLIVGVVGYLSTNTISDGVDEIVEATPLVDAAMEMKISVARDMQMVMELLESPDTEELDHVWLEHKKFEKDFNIFANAIIDGAETE